MWRAAVGLVVGVGAFVFGAGAVAGQQPDSTPTPEVVAAAIAEDGWYADPESVGDREQLDMVADRLARDGDPMGFALLAAEPPGSSTAFAEEVLDELIALPDADVETVVVLSDADVGVVSDVWSDSRIDAALDETIDDIRANRTDGLEALADALATSPSGFGDDTDDSYYDDSSDSSDGGPDTGVLLAAVLVVVGVALASRFWTDLQGDYEGGTGDDETGSSWTSSRRRSFYRPSRSSSRSSSSRSRSSSSSSRSRSSSSRGRGGRRL